MAEPTSPPPVKMICGMISCRRELFDSAMKSLTDLMGPADRISELMNFDFTHYYDQEMGQPLYRRFVSFDTLATPQCLARIKLATNGIERDFAASSAAGPPRPINLDPGYLEPSKLVLASMKNFSHRIYLSDGVYAEVTLLYRRGLWQSLPWTFPDYASGRYHAFLNAVRDRLREQLKDGE